MLLARSTVTSDYFTVQCDVCIPPTIATNHGENHRRAGWTLVADGASLDVCPTCHERRVRQVARRDRPELRRDQGGCWPNLVMIGSAKAGTSSLHSYLDAHPQIAMSAIKELQFFQDPNGDEWAGHYRAQFSADHAVTGESSTLYSRWPAIPGVAERIAAVAPDAKIVFSVREPVSRAVASYKEEVFHGLEPRSITEALSEVGEPLNPYLAPSRFASQLAEFRKHFPDEQILVVTMAELSSAPAALMRKLFTFLGVDPDIAVDTSERINVGADKVVYEGMAGKLRSSWLGLAWRKLPLGLRARIFAPFRARIGTKMEIAAASDATLDRFRDALRDDAADFERLTGISVLD